MVQWIVALTNYVIDRSGFALRGAPGTLEIFAKSAALQARCHMVNPPRWLLHYDHKKV